MRTLSTFEHLVATADDDGIALHQFAGGTVAAPLGGGEVSLHVETDYPWQGAVAIVVDESPERPWALRVRVPGWLRAGTMTSDGLATALQPGSGEVVVERAWRTGDRIELDMGLAARFTLPDERIDAVRACAAIERGPLVYCLEQADLPSGVALDDVEVDGSRAPALAPSSPEPLPSTVLALRVSGRARPTGAGEGHAAWPYRDAGEPASRAVPDPLTLTAIPYFAWANRSPGPMRVWLPVAAPGAEDTEASSPTD
jgi:hypothetical protein